jgi:phospholipase/lecithinase/hemolysin
LAAFLFAGLSSSSWADPINAIYAFGDSLSDAGNAFIATSGAEPAAPYVNGHFTNGNVWVQDLAASLNLPPVTASLAGGTDYAVGSAESGQTPVRGANIAGDLPWQISQFQTANAAANPNGLYTIWIGANDLADILASNPTPLAAATDVAAVIGNINVAINQLAGDGAKNFLIVTVPDLGKTPGAIAGGPLVQAAASNLSAVFDANLANAVTATAALDSLNLKVLDTYSLTDAIVANPAQFGLTNVTQPCLTGEVNYAGGTPCADPNQYLFWDQLHPTAAGQLITADVARQVVVPEPATQTMLFGAGFLAFLFTRRRLLN